MSSYVNIVGPTKWGLYQEMKTWREEITAMITTTKLIWMGEPQRDLFMEALRIGFKNKLFYESMLKWYIYRYRNDISINHGIGPHIYETLYRLSDYGKHEINPLTWDHQEGDWQQELSNRGFINECKETYPIHDILHVQLIPEILKLESRKGPEPFERVDLVELGITTVGS